MPATIDPALLANLSITPLPLPTPGESTPTEPSHSPAPPKAPKPDGPKQSDPFQFGSRFLNPDDDPMSFNAWDHVEVDDEYISFAKEQFEKQKAKPVNEFDKKRFMERPAKWWDTFYKNNSENFFKNRKWLAQEFPILKELTREDAPAATIVELGCGAGNTLFPILAQNENPNLHLHGADFSATAINTVIRTHPLYVQHSPSGLVSSSVYDLGAAESLPEGIEENSVDVVIMVFVFSALSPQEWGNAIGNVKRMLKEGGTVLLRDYGRLDLAQVRFKGQRWLGENFYVRGDGTRVYFFEEGELERIFTGKETERRKESDLLKGKEEELKVEEMGDEEADKAVERGEAVEGEEAKEEVEGCKKEEVKGGSGVKVELEHPNFGGFVCKEMAMDKRMLVNRKRQIKMYRRWVQAVFEKI